MKLTLLPGYIYGRRLKIDLELKDDSRLSISGEYNRSFGQIQDSITVDDILHHYEPAAGWTPFVLLRLMYIWKRWHLNDMQAASPEQNEVIRMTKELGWTPDRSNHFDNTSKMLATMDVNPDSNGYKYGSGWLSEELPKDVLGFISFLTLLSK